MSKVPKQALTVGVGTIMDSREVMVLVTGAHKALALSKVNVCVCLYPADPVCGIHRGPERRVHGSGLVNPGEGKHLKKSKKQVLVQPMLVLLNRPDLGPILFGIWTLLCPPPPKKKKKKKRTP